MKTYLFEKKHIKDQLALEEKLLKDDNSYLLINKSPSPSIVMGVTNKEDDLIHKEAVNDNIEIVRRFSAGGTVFLDENSIIVTFIFSKKDIDIEFFPEPIMRWAFDFYKDVFEIKNFKLIENDFVIDNKKIAGNAKYIKRDKFLLHTSFLWDFDINKISRYLKLPNKAPCYREKRDHLDFLKPIKSFFLNKNNFIEKISNKLNLFINHYK
jgi:lipoate-protein ligase A